MNISVRILDVDDDKVLERVAPGVFDNAVDPRWTREFLADSRHHLAVALDAGLVVGMASGVHYVHPDKPPELWVNEVAVAPTHRGRGVARRMLETLFERARTLVCHGAWVATEPTNNLARRLYAAVGGVEASKVSVIVEFCLLTDEDSTAGTSRV